MYRSIFSDPFPTSINDRINNLNDRVTTIENSEGGTVEERDYNFFLLIVTYSGPNYQAGPADLLRRPYNNCKVWIPKGSINTDGTPYLFDVESFRSTGSLPYFPGCEYRPVRFFIKVSPEGLVGTFKLEIGPTTAPYYEDYYTLDNNNNKEYSIYLKFDCIIGRFDRIPYSLILMGDNPPDFEVLEMRILINF